MKDQSIYKPRPPKWLTNNSKKIWKRIVGELAKEDYFRSIDLELLAQYCEQLATIEQCTIELTDENGEIELTYTITTEKGSSYEQQRPQVSIRDKAISQSRRLLAELGLTPKARKALGTLVDDEDEFDDDPDLD